MPAIVRLAATLLGVLIAAAAAPARASDLPLEPLARDDPPLDLLRPLYRWTSSALGAHFYTLDPDPPGPLSLVASIERTEGFVLPLEIPGTVALTALFRPKDAVNVVTTQTALRDELVAHHGFLDVGVQGWIFSEAGPGREALHALWSASTTDLLLTVSEDEAADLTADDASPHFVELGVQGYVVPYFAIGEPSGQFAGLAPRGIILLIHGGAWQDDGEASVTSDLNLAEAERWQARGWRTIALSHRPSREGPASAWRALFGPLPPVVPGSATRSIEDVAWFYDEVKQTTPPGTPICASGWSSGGHLALLLAALRPELACVVAQAAPTNLPALAAEGTLGGIAATFAFGAAHTTAPADAFSPVALASAIRAQVLLATAENDEWVPASQMDAMRAAMASAGRSRQIKTLRLAAGSQEFWHGTVSAAALTELRRTENRLAECLTEERDPATCRTP